ncbi:MAG: DUF2330 domain-containing protein [Myxococcota bacterium]
MTPVVGMSVGMLWALSGSAWACAGLVHDDTSLAESDAAEVLFEPGDGEVAVSYAVAYTGNAADFGWVIPVPGAVSAIEDGDADRIASLRQASQPVVSWPSADQPSAGCACGGAAKSGDSLESRSNDLEIVAEGFTGTYAYVVIEATDADALTAWFTDNGWAGIDPDDVAHYVSIGAAFAALQVVPETADTPVDGRLLPPVRIRYAGDALLFPAVMARHAAVSEQHTTLYVVGADRATLAGWTFEEPSGLSGSDPVAVWDDALAALGADRAYARTFAGAVDGGFLTRFDTIAPTEVHDADVTLALGDGTDGFQVTIRVDGGDSGSEAAIPLGLLLLAGVGARRLSPRGRGRELDVTVGDEP